MLYEWSFFRLCLYVRQISEGIFCETSYNIVENGFLWMANRPKKSEAKAETVNIWQKWWALNDQLCEEIRLGTTTLANCLKEEMKLIYSEKILQLRNDTEALRKMISSGSKCSSKEGSLQSDNEENDRICSFFIMMTSNTQK